MAIDEQLVAFGGRCKFKQFMPSVTNKLICVKRIVFYVCIFIVICCFILQ